MPLTRRDFRFNFSASGSQLGVRLEYRPYYRLETQEIVTYTPDSKATTAELLLGLATSGLFVWAFVDNLLKLVKLQSMMKENSIMSANSIGMGQVRCKKQLY